MNTNQELEKLAITAEELQNDLGSEKPLLVFDLRLKEHYNQGHVEGSVHAVCDSRAKETIMPKIPKSVKIVLIDEDGTIAAETAGMMTSYGFDAHFLKGGIGGGIIGTKFATKIPQQKLLKLFGILLFLVASYIVVRVITA